MPYWDETHQTAYQRDTMIIELRRRGLSYRQISRRVHMSANGVMTSLRRIQAGARQRPPPIALFDTLAATA
jgi:hypothetical protein